MPSSSSNSPAVCPNGHAMDEGLFECPACGAYRSSAHAPSNGWEGVPLSVLAELADEAGFDPADCC